MALALELRDSERQGPATSLFTARFADFTWGDAREVARARDRLRRDEGERMVGYKLGWTSAAMRDALGIDRPNWGTVWSRHVVEGSVLLDGFRHPKIEPELVYRDGAWALGIEVVDPRFPGYDFHWLDNTADNSSVAAVAFGPFVELDADPADVAVEFSDGDTPRTGLGSAAMASPLAAVEWLRTQLAAEGEQLEPANFVFTGGLTAPFDVRRGGRYTLESPLLPGVSITFS